MATKCASEGNNKTPGWNVKTATEIEILYSIMTFLFQNSSPCIPSYRCQVHSKPLRVGRRLSAFSIGGYLRIWAMQRWGNGRPTLHMGAHRIPPLRLHYKPLYFINEVQRSQRRYSANKWLNWDLVPKTSKSVLFQLPCSAGRWWCNLWL